MTSQEFEKVLIGKMITNPAIMETVFRYINMGRFLIDGDDNRVVLHAIKNASSKNGTSKFAVAEELFTYYKENCFNVVNEYFSAANSMDSKEVMERFLMECKSNDKNVDLRSASRVLLNEIAESILCGNISNISTGKNQEVAYMVYLQSGVCVSFYKNSEKDPSIHLSCGNVTNFPISLKLIEDLYNQKKSPKIIVEEPKEEKDEDIEELPKEEKKVENKLTSSFFDKFLK